MIKDPGFFCHPWFETSILKVTSQKRLMSSGHHVLIPDNRYEEEEKERHLLQLTVIPLSVSPIQDFSYSSLSRTNHIASLNYWRDWEIESFN